MLSTLFKIGPIAVHSYGLLIAIGFLLALRLMLRQAPKQGIDPNFIERVAPVTLLLGILGTRVLHIILYPENYAWNDPIGWIAIWNGGLVFQGAFILAPAYLLYMCYKYKVSFWGFCDLVAPYVPLGHAFGRMGCFMHGCCYGVRTDLPWGVRFPRVPWDLTQAAEGSPVYLDHCSRFSALSVSADHWSYPVHPTQLYGVIGLLACFGIMILLRKRWNPFVGWALPMYMMFYGIGRFFVEFLRGDHNPTMFGLLSAQQVFSLFTLALGLILFFVLRTWARSNPTKPIQPAPSE